MRFPLLVALSFLPACHGRHHEAPGVPVFPETERNDDPRTANHFGDLHVGEHFFIDGFVRDDLADPFDGFAFTAAEPLHVDFQLFIGNRSADLDVCLYDPALDETLECFATAADPERGGVNVSAGGLDFHLVIESFVGDATYSLEIVVLPLFAARSGEEGVPERKIQGVEAHSERETRAAKLYRKPQVEHALMRIEETLHIDADSGLALHFVRSGS